MRTIAAAAAALIAGCSGGGSGKKGSPSSVEVSVVAAGSLAPIVGARVVVHDADGAPIATLLTSANGIAVVDDPDEGTMITVVTTAGGDAWMRTVMGVEPGDELLVPIPNGVAAPAPSPVATPGFAFASGYAGAFGYALELGCSVELVFGTNGTASVGPECVATDGTYDAVAIAGDSGADPLAFTVLENVSLSQAPLAFPAWRTDFTAHTLEVTAAPPGVIDLFGSVLTRADRGAFGTGDTAVNNTAGTGTFVIRLVPDAAGGTVTGLDLAYGTGNTPDGRALYFVGAAGIAASQSLDLAAAVLPRANTAAFATTSGGTISWTTSAGVTGDVLQVAAEWLVAGTDFRQWIVYAPAGTVSPLVLPALPPEIAPLVPAATPGTLRIRFFEADFIGGYPAFRNEYLSWAPTGTINLTSTAALQAVPLDRVPQSFVLKISETGL